LVIYQESLYDAQSTKYKFLCAVCGVKLGLERSRDIY